jgi:hypothetical protein
VDAVAGSIREFGFRQPIVVDEEGFIIVGHTRYKAASKLGMTPVPVHVAKGLSPAQAKEYRIADNQTASISDWDDKLLPLELAELQQLDFDLNLTGFSPEEEGQTDPDDIPEPPDEPKTKLGDLWLLGRHRLLCGDSSKAEDVDRLLAGAKIHLVNTDPPYHVKVEPRSNNAIAAGLSSFEGTKHHRSMDVARHLEKAKPTAKKLRAKDRPLANDFVSDETFDALLTAWFVNLARVLQPGRAFYIWGGYANVANYPAVLFLLPRKVPLNRKHDCHLFSSSRLVPSPSGEPRYTGWWACPLLVDPTAVYRPCLLVLLLSGRRMPVSRPGISRATFLAWRSAAG